MALFGDINRVEIMGNLTQDPELRFTSGGTAVGSFSVATNRSYKQGDDYKDEVTYHNIVVWGNLAQSLSQRAKKGTRIMIVGRIQNRSWEGNDGQKKYRTEIVADDAFLIDRYEKGKLEGGNSPATSQNANNPMSSSAPNAASNSAPPQGGNEEVDPDDLPF